jgi:protein ImuB
MALLPEGPPKRFRWRGATHGVLHSEGPERIADEWWRSPDRKPDRDYYFVEDEKGRRFWLYREGISEEAPAPRWFVHGLFG